MRENPEARLCERLSAWLTEQGYAVYCEIQMLGYVMDLVAVKDGVVIVLEAKTSLTRRVQYQACRGQLYGDLSYAAVGTSPRKRSLEHCRKIGVGVYRVTPESVTLVLEAQRMPNLPFPEHRRRMLNMLAEIEPGGTAGLPTCAGIGPAQDCYDRIQIYREAHPKATGRQIYEEVSNHYCNHRSLQAAMRVVEQNRRKRQRRLRASAEV